MHRPVRRNGVLQPDPQLVKKLATAATLAHEASKKQITIAETPDFYVVIRPLPGKVQANYSVYNTTIDEALGFSFQQLFPAAKPIISLSPDLFPMAPLPGLEPCIPVEDAIRHELVHHMQFARGSQGLKVHALRSSRPAHGLPPRGLHPPKAQRDKDPYWWGRAGSTHELGLLEFQPLIGDALADVMRHSAWRDPAVDLRRLIQYHPFPAWEQNDPKRWRMGVQAAAAAIEKLYVQRHPDRNRVGPAYKGSLEAAVQEKIEANRAAEIERLFKAAQEAEAAQREERKAQLASRLRAARAKQQTEQELRQRQQAAAQAEYLNSPPVPAHLYEVRRGPDPRDPRGGGQVWIVYKDTQPTTKYAKTKQKALELMAEMEARHG